MGRMKELKFNSLICTTIEQSKKIVGFGIKTRNCGYDSY